MNENVDMGQMDALNAARQSGGGLEGKKSKGRGWGCVAIGCISILIIIVVGAVLIFFAFKSQIEGLAKEFTATEPLALPSLQIPPDEVESAKAMFERFSAAVEAGERTEPLELDTRTVNALLRSWEDLGDRIYVEITGDRVGGMVSFPLAEFPLADSIGIADRYLNGRASFDVTLIDGRLQVYIEELEVNGQGVPDAVMQELRTENIAADVRNNPEARDLVDRLDRIEIRDSKLIVVPR